MSDDPLFIDAAWEAEAEWRAEARELEAEAAEEARLADLERLGPDCECIDIDDEGGVDQRGCPVHDVDDDEWVTPPCHEEVSVR